MPKNPPDSMQHHLRQRLNRHACGRWPQVNAITVRFRAGFAYVDAELPGEQTIRLCRLRFTGMLHTWSFALYLASNDSYQDNILPNGLPAGSPEEALDCAGNLYLNTPAPGASGLIRVLAGLVVLVGPPASGKTSFVRALIASRQIEEEAVVSSDEIRAELFGTSPAEADSEAADARIFEERDRRIVARLASGHSAVAESTNVTPQARARLIAIARRFNSPVTMLRFDPDVTDLLQQHAGRGRTDITATDVRAYAAIMARHAAADQLRSEGATAVHDVPGRRQGTTPAEAAARFFFV
ncbi:ATP-binding protein [Streptacidiphilus melanogenes]|uniref:ATP-binding protein n=1 Tax=Streptacidiphilus melanogenes TaxID=411235 RepID=UPI0005A684B3|nr:ATP-binding protein [Streptacidiphilus melanogenes]